MVLGFSKEILINEISTLNNFETLQYLGMNVYLLSFIAILLIPLIAFIIAYECSKSFYLSLGISTIISVLLMTLTLIGILPGYLTIN